MSVNFELNANNTESLGLFFKRGSLYKELLKLPKPKQRVFNEWPDEHGKEYDTTSPTVYESLTYTIDCYLVAADVADLMNKRRVLLELLSAPDGFSLYSNTLQRGYSLRYIDSPSFNTLVPVWRNDTLYCEFSLALENNFDAVDVLLPLATEGGLVLTEDNEKIYVQDKRQLF